MICGWGDLGYSLTNPSPDEERDRSRDVCRSVDEEGDIDDETDVELDRYDQLDLDLDSEHNDGDLESDVLSHSEDRAGSAEEFQWSPTLLK